MKQHVTCVIEFTEHNLCAYLDWNVGCVVSTADTVEGIKRKQREGVELLIEESLKDGYDLAPELRGEWELVFVFDLVSLLEAHRELIPLLSRLSGVSRRRLERYAGRLSKPRPATVRRVAEGIRAFGRQLANTNFV